MTKVKICGITRLNDALAAADCGVEFIGFNFWPRSKRHVSLQRAADIAEALDERGHSVELVGVFVNQGLLEIESVSRHVGIEIIQLHGNEGAAVVEGLEHPIIKAISLRDESDLDRVQNAPCDHVLLDTPDPGFGGSGRIGNWDLARRAALADKRVILAGGLNPCNVAAAIETVAPYAVDVASGVESAPGQKDHTRLADFVAAARGRV